MNAKRKKLASSKNDIFEFEPRSTNSNELLIFYKKKMLLKKYLCTIENYFSIILADQLKCCSKIIPLRILRNDIAFSMPLNRDLS